MTDQKKCFNCKFFKDIGFNKGQFGECRRHSPFNINQEFPPIAAWPRTDAHDWCGDWEFGL